MGAMMRRGWQRGNPKARYQRDEAGTAVARRR
jgi:hypothetical protein